MSVTTHCVLLDSSNALDILTQYDVIVDATDNVATRYPQYMLCVLSRFRGSFSRYLLNDACVLLGRPLVSGSALRFEGQLTVYGCHGGPCYRCLFPSPPPPHTVTNCSEGGVLGVGEDCTHCDIESTSVPSVSSRYHWVSSGTGSSQDSFWNGAYPHSICLILIPESDSLTFNLASYSQQLLLFDGICGVFRNIKLRPRQPQCTVCGDNPSITALIDYELFCGSRADDKVSAVVCCGLTGPDVCIHRRNLRNCWLLTIVYLARSEYVM